MHDLPIPTHLQTSDIFHCVSSPTLPGLQYKITVLNIFGPHQLLPSPPDPDNMTHSAFVGHPPANQDDYWIIKGFLRQLGLPEKMIHPEKGLPIHRPPNASDDERGTELLTAMCVAMALIIIITGTRLSLRYFRHDLKWGLDDWMLIPALVCL